MATDREARQSPNRIYFTVYDGDVEIDTSLPAVWSICQGCRGHGQHDHPAFSNGITAEEWQGPDWDDDSREDYLRGAYDVPCEECKGLGRVLVVDESAILSQEEQAHYDRLQANWAEMAEMHAIEAAERRAGA